MNTVPIPPTLQLAAEQRGTEGAWEAAASLSWTGWLLAFHTQCQCGPCTICSLSCGKIAMTPPESHSTTLRLSEPRLGRCGRGAGVFQVYLGWIRWGQTESAQRGITKGLLRGELIPPVGADEEMGFSWERGRGWACKHLVVTAPGRLRPGRGNPGRGLGLRARSRAQYRRPTCPRAPGFSLALVL